MGSYNCPNNRPLIESWCGTPSPADPDKNCAAADPVLPANGVTILTETDFASGDDTPLKFIRSYRSSPFIRTDAGIGVSWFHNWQRQLGLANAGGNPPQVSAYRPEGGRVVFAKSGDAWRVVDGSPLSLTQQSSSWTLKDLLTDETETYSAQGVLQSVSTRTNMTTSLTYSDSSTPMSIAPASGLLISIRQHAAGSNPNIDLRIQLAYDSQQRIIQMTDPTGAVTRYGYDTHNNLVSATLPDGNVRRYVYDDKRFLAVLTGIIDEGGSRAATWAYDEQGRVVAVSHPDTTKNVQLSYGGGSTTLTDGKGYTFLASSLIAGMQRPTVVNSTLGNGTVTWDSSGRLLTQTSGNGDSATYTYDDAGRPTKSVRTTTSGTAITSIRYADATSLLPSLIASPGWMRSYVYDTNGNTTGISELSTDDPTGVKGFDASTAGGQTRTYGMAYYPTNLLLFAQMYENGIKTGEWSYVVDAYGSLRQSTNRINLSSQIISIRDQAHRAAQINGPGFTASIAYDSRGRVTIFWYSEQAGVLNGNVSRTLKVNFAYTANGDVSSRTATVSTNQGPDVAITSDEIDTWLSNYERGITPAGPPPNHVGAAKSMLGAANQTEPLCVLCYLRAANPVAQRLYYGESNRWANPLDTGPNLPSTPKKILAAAKCTDGCAAEKAACRTLCSTARYDPDMRNIWGGSMRRCMMGCIPARCGGN
jgi:YD repeat-containing protein